MGGLSMFCYTETVLHGVPFVYPELKCVRHRLTEDLGVWIQTHSSWASWDNLAISTHLQHIQLNWYSLYHNRKHLKCLLALTPDKRGYIWNEIDEKTERKKVKERWWGSSRKGREMGWWALAWRRLMEWRLVGWHAWTQFARLQTPEQLLVCATQSLFLITFLLHILLQVSILLWQLSEKMRKMISLMQTTAKMIMYGWKWLSFIELFSLAIWSHIDNVILYSLLFAHVLQHTILNFDFSSISTRAALTVSKSQVYIIAQIHYFFQ